MLLICKNLGFKNLIWIICLWISSCFADYQYELSVCMIFRDEAPYLKEWIEFYRLLGVQHFYLCNHSSTDDFREVLEPYIKEGIVELRERNDDHSDPSLYFFLEAHQNAYFSEILQKARGESKWVAFLDSDEFLYPTQKNSLIEVLKDYEEFGGVTANWQMFGTSHVAKLDPKKLMIEQLVDCAPSDALVNLHVKSIVRPERAIDFRRCAYYAIYEPGFFQVNTNKEQFEGPFSPYVLVDQLRINHYWTRDEYYLWNFKIPRRNHFGDPLHFITSQNENYNSTTDFSIQRFVPALRKRMGLD